MPRLPYRSNPLPTTVTGAYRLGTAIATGLGKENKMEAPDTTGATVDIDGKTYDFLDMFKHHVYCVHLGDIVEPEQAARCGCDAN